MTKVFTASVPIITLSSRVFISKPPTEVILGAFTGSAIFMMSASEYPLVR